MSWVIPVWRRSLCHTMGGVIHEALTRGVPVIGWWSFNGIVKHEADRVPINEVRAQWPTLPVTTARPNGVWVAPSGEHSPWNMPAVWIDYVWDTLHQPPMSSALIGFASEFQRDQYQTVWNRLPAQWKLVGSPMLPPSPPGRGKTIVCFVPKFRPGWARKGNWIRTARILLAVRRAGRRWGLPVILKTRGKHGRLFGLNAFADQTIGDGYGTLWPSPSQQLLDDAALIIGFQGGGALWEAAARNIPAIAVEAPLTPTLPPWMRRIMEIKISFWSLAPGLIWQFPITQAVTFLDGLKMPPSGNVNTQREFQRLLTGDCNPQEWFPRLRDACLL